MKKQFITDSTSKEAPEGDIDLASLMPRRTSFSVPIGGIHHLYLSGVIKEPAEYIDWFNLIRNAGEHDIIVIYINSPGGYLSTALQFLSVFQDSDAQIIACVEGECMSAATMLFLAADAYQVMDHSTFMFHNYSGGMIGKGGEMYDQASHYNKWSEKFLRDVYKNFLKEEEIQSIMKNVDLWMDAEEVGKRLEKKMQANAKEHKAAVRQAKESVKSAVSAEVTSKSSKESEPEKVVPVKKVPAKKETEKAIPAKKETEKAIPAKKETEKVVPPKKKNPSKV